MQSWQIWVLIIFDMYAWMCFLAGIRACLQKRAFSIHQFGFIIGSFVWADAVICGLFWGVGSLIFLVRQDWIGFLLLLSLFWVVRSGGEVMYWMNQQFSTLMRNPPKTLHFHRLFYDDSIWFIYQLFWQCVLVISFMGLLILSKLWLSPI